MSSWKSIKVETFGKKRELYIWEKEKLKDLEFEFIGAYAVYSYGNDLLYAGITKTRDVGIRILEHLNATGSNASTYICKQLNRQTAEFTGYKTGYEEYIYRIEVYEFKKPEAHIWFEQYLINEYNPVCNIDGRTDLPKTDKITLYEEWDIRREKYFKEVTVHKDNWSSFEEEAARINISIEQVVLRSLAKEMGFEYPYFHLNKPNFSKMEGREYLNEDQFVSELITKLKTKGKNYTSKEIYKMARDIGISENHIELARLGKQPVLISKLIP